MRACLPFELRMRRSHNEQLRASLGIARGASRDHPSNGALLRNFATFREGVYPA